PEDHREVLLRVRGAQQRPVLGPRRPGGPERAQEGERQDRARGRQAPRRGGEALQRDHRGLDQEGERDGRGREGRAAGVPRRAEEGGGREVAGGRKVRGRAAPFFFVPPV